MERLLVDIRLKPLRKTLAPKLKDWLRRRNQSSHSETISAYYAHPADPA
jgi:hypothetical protein